MLQYIHLINHIIQNGTKRIDRTGVGTLSIFGYQMRFNLSDGFPLVTTKKVHFKSIVHELLWFISGNTNIHYLNENSVNIWNEWADHDGNLGPVYGAQWRSWHSSNETIDQLQNVIDLIKRDPHSRRLIVSAWNVGDIPKMALPPCHLLFQFYVNDNKLSCQLYQRSADVFLGVPFNIASYSLLLMMVANVCGLVPDEFIHTIGDAHIYQNHMTQAMLQVSRDTLPLPSVLLKKSMSNINDFQYDDIELINYLSHQAIKGTIAI